MHRPSGFLVLTSQRTGSTWVVDVLNRLDGLKTYGELFLAEKRERPETVSNDYPRFIEFEGRQSGFRRHRSVFRYLDGLYQQPDVVGFKLMYSQARVFPEVFAYLRLRGIPVVHLIRGNHLDVVISSRAAETSGRSHVRSGEGEVDRVRLELNTAGLLQRLRRLRRHQRIARFALRLWGLRHMEISYERLLEDKESFLEICDFLHLPISRRIPGSGLVKRRKGSIEDLVTNIGEVRELLANSEFADLLDG